MELKDFRMVGSRLVTQHGAAPSVLLIERYILLGSCNKDKSITLQDSPLPACPLTVASIQAISEDFDGKWKSSSLAMYKIFPSICKVTTDADCSS